VCVFLGLNGAVAGAAEPVNQACVGTTYSEAVQLFQDAGAPPGSLGQFVAGLAQAPGTAHPGLGDGIQALQAGTVPDSVAINTCND
jgi:hypothetical protein